MVCETSIIIRTKNEERWLGAVLKILSKQTYRNFEIIIVDSGSIDRTLEIAREFPVKIFEIPPKDFSYPYALNYGIERSSAANYIVIISGHSVPVSETWLSDGLENFKRYKNIMGIYGFLKPLPYSSFCDKLIMKGLNFWRHLIGKAECLIIKEAKMGVLGFTNAIILKDLWKKRHFNEAFGAGGEDGEWAAFWFERGYTAIKDEKFTVYHSHSLGLFGWYRQFQYWKSLSRPSSFQKLSFRKDKTHQAIS